MQREFPVTHFLDKFMKSLTLQDATKLSLGVTKQDKKYILSKVDKTAAKILQTPGAFTEALKTKNTTIPIILTQEPPYFKAWIDQPVPVSCNSINFASVSFYIQDSPNSYFMYTAYFSQFNKTGDLIHYSCVHVTENQQERPIFYFSTVPDNYFHLYITNRPTAETPIKTPRFIYYPGNAAATNFDIKTMFEFLIYLTKESKFTLKPEGSSKCEKEWIGIVQEKLKFIIANELNQNKAFRNTFMKAIKSKSIE